MTVDSFTFPGEIFLILLTHSLLDPTDMSYIPIPLDRPSVAEGGKPQQRFKIGQPKGL